MNHLYFDANYLGKLQWPEHGSTEVAACASHAGDLYTATHGGAEFYSSGHRKLREGKATTIILKTIFAQFDSELAAGKIVLLPLTDAIIDRIETVCATAPATTYLRAADALHLATAAVHGFTEIHSNDKHFLAAAPLFGLVGVNVIP
jgi:predicted nucleic acid-binding protein